MSNQYLRKASLLVFGNPPTPGGSGIPVPAAPAASAGPNGVTRITIPLAQPAGSQSVPGIEIDDLRIQFNIMAMDIDSPPTAIIRVINLSDATAKRIQKEFQGVVLQAGYENGNFGVIFQGSIIRVKKGKIDQLNSFVDIFASNLDAIYNFGVVNKTLKAGSSLNDRLNAIAQSVNSSPVAQGQAGALQQGLVYGNIPSSFGTGGVLPRGKVLFGMARDHLGNITDSQGCTWQVGPDGKINIIPLTGYLDGDAVVITSQTGMIGVPEATQQGIEVRCLLNPLIKTGTRIQLDNKSITTTQNTQASGFPSYGDFAFFASINDDGFYRSIVVEHSGDSRGSGNDWLTRITALNVDPSAAPDNSVAAYG
jgi:hypothetical protein